MGLSHDFHQAKIKDNIFIQETSFFALRTKNRSIPSRIFRNLQQKKKTISFIFHQDRNDDSLTSRANTILVGTKQLKTIDAKNKGSRIEEVKIDLLNTQIGRKSNILMLFPLLAIL